MLKKLLVSVLAVGLGLTSLAHAAGGAVKEYKHPHFPTDGIWGHFDQAQLQRGYQVYREVCASCHSMELLSFRHLADKDGPYYLEECPKNLGIPSSVDCSNPAQNPIVKSLAASFQVQDGPDDSGDMFLRPGLPSDPFPAPYANKKQAQAANGGAYPPDMSLLVKARHHGAAYIYSLLQGYETPPENITVAAGQHYNVYYAGDPVSLLKDEYKDENGVPLDGVKVPYGGTFKMAAPLSEGIVTYEDGTPETVAQYSKDVTAFLIWASEPKLQQRKAQGRFVLLYLFIFAGIVYVSYRSVWRNVH